MLHSTLTQVVAALNAAGIAATPDARNITTPGAFVTVTKLVKCTLSGDWLTSGDILLIAPDHGGMHDVAALDKLLTRALPMLDRRGIEVSEITTNEVATPPSGGALPAIKFSYTLYL